MKRYKSPDILFKEIDNFPSLQSSILYKEIFDTNLTLLIDHSNIREVLKHLKEEETFNFTQLIDL